MTNITTNNILKKLFLTKIKSTNKSIIKSTKKIQRGGGYKWSTLEHNGVLFPAEYEPHQIPLKYNTTSVELTPIQEEYAMLYAKYINTDYVENKTFNRNFWNDWKKLLGKESQIQSLELCDFTEFHQKILDEKEALKTIRDPTKPIESEGNMSEAIMNRVYYNIDSQEEEKYKTAIVDGKPQPVSNYRMEPPGIFLGRGDNPKIGKIKLRVYPEEVTINIGSEAPIPPTLKGHKWGKIIHDRYVEWLASWKENINGKTNVILFTPIIRSNNKRP